mmetsp:Transcript_7107/g.23548  ORF Transcript_7107/g.23548 Transcript_7107/m.23548 type:complete len:219 (-) Transcript_7107:562-1218(-)
MVFGARTRRVLGLGRPERRREPWEQQSRRCGERRASRAPPRGCAAPPRGLPQPRPRGAARGAASPHGCRLLVLTVRKERVPSRLIAEIRRCPPQARAPPKPASPAERPPQPRHQTRATSPTSGAETLYRSRRRERKKLSRSSQAAVVSSAGSVVPRSAEAERLWCPSAIVVARLSSSSSAVAAVVATAAEAALRWRWATSASSSKAARAASTRAWAPP